MAYLAVMQKLKYWYNMGTLARYDGGELLNIALCSYQKNAQNQGFVRVQE